MKAKDVLQITGISRRQLSRLVKNNSIRVRVKPNGQYEYNVEDVYKYLGKKRRNLNVIYTRVSTSKQKPDLLRQIELLEDFCSARGVQIDEVFSDVASGINFKNRKRFFDLLKLVINGQVEKVFISYKDRLSRVDFDLFKYLLLHFGTEIVVVFGQGNEKLDDQELMSEIISLIHCFSMKHYSKRHIQRAIEVLDEKSTKNEN
ncbi:MAG TPA: IS607 family transposase [Thioploca sp.]|nr:IS607 family transposase [Thioploca sp.]